jgi:hypothetical protein
MMVVFMLLAAVAAAPPTPDLKPQKATVRLLPSGWSANPGAAPIKVNAPCGGVALSRRRTDNPILEITQDWLTLLANLLTSQKINV